jgi:hypothetical protein
MNPDRDAIERWRASYPVLVDAARAEAERRAELRRRELVELATRLREEELEALAVWRYEEREPRPSPRRARRSCKRLPECRLNPDSRSPQEEQV